MKLNTVIDQKNVGWIDFTGITLLTAIGILKGEVTVFYVIYLFWCSEVLTRIIAFLALKRRQWQGSTEKGKFSGGAFLLFIYFVFIVVIFGFLANSDNSEVLLLNMNILFFKHTFFNLSLLFIVLEQVLFHYGSERIRLPNDGFSANLIVLHISIILGAFAIFFVVRKFPEFFTPENTMGSLLVVAPFLLLRAFVQAKSAARAKAQRVS